MAVMLINQDEIPAGLAPGTYCCRLDESSHWGDFRARLVIPPRAHEPGDCLIQVIKTDPVPGTGDESEEG